MRSQRARIIGTRRICWFTEKHKSLARYAAKRCSERRSAAEAAFIALNVNDRAHRDQELTATADRTFCSIGGFSGLTILRSVDFSLPQNEQFSILTAFIITYFLTVYLLLNLSPRFVFNSEVTSSNVPCVIDDLSIT